MCRFCQKAQLQLQEDYHGASPPPLSDDGATLTTTGGDGRWATPPLSTSVTVSDKLEAERCIQFRSNRVPVTLLTGFLGSGKTTLLNRLLTNASGKRLAVIENEFGEVSIDDQLLPSTDLVVEAIGKEVVLLPNGCLCCRARADLADALRKTFEAAEGRLDGVILEMSGLSEVGPVVQTFFTDDQVQSNFRVDGIVCVCDARNLAAALRGQEEEEEGKALALIQEQLALADRVLLNKADVVGGPEEMERVRRFVRSINATAPVLECVRGEVAVAELLGLEALSLDKAISRDPHFIEDQEEEGKEAHHDHHHHHEQPPPAHKHVALDYSATAVQIDDGPLEWVAVEKWLQELMEGPGQGLICRFKGVICATKRTPYRRSTIVIKRVVIQGVYGFTDSAEGGDWEAGSPHCSKVVFIGKMNTELREYVNKGLLACLAPGYAPKALVRPS